MWCPFDWAPCPTAKPAEQADRSLIVHGVDHAQDLRRGKPWSLKTRGRTERRISSTSRSISWPSSPRSFESDVPVHARRLGGADAARVRVRFARLPKRRRQEGVLELRAAARCDREEASVGQGRGVFHMVRSVRILCYPLATGSSSRRSCGISSTRKTPIERQTYST